MVAIIDPLKQYVKDAAASAPPLVVHVDTSELNIRSCVCLVNDPNGHLLD